MKKKSIIIIAAVVAASLSACVGNNSIAVPEATTNAESSVVESSIAESTVSESTVAESSVSESINDLSTQPDANMHEDETIPEEKIDIDISDCKDFEQVIDKLEADMGYAELKIGGTDVLLVTPGTFKGDDKGTRAATVAEVYWVDKDNNLKDGGHVRSGGTANPLTAAGDYIYASGHHYVKRYTLNDDNLVIDLEASEKFDEKGNVTYYLRSELRDVDADANGEVKDDSALNDLNKEMYEADIIGFTVISKSN